MPKRNPNFRNSEFLIHHIQSILDFYHPNCIDRIDGGFFQHFRDDGSIYDADTRHLVSSARFVFNYAMAASYFRREEYRDAVWHGIEFLRTRHRNPETGGYAWILRKGQAIDGTNHCYGLAFVLLAYAMALRANIEEAARYLRETYDLLERHFWSKKDELYKDEISPDWRTVSSYRGQNANMHTCEAMLASFQVTGDEKYLDRAHTLARRITIDQAAKAGDIIWEHYDENWEIDWQYNKDDPRNLFRPWGYQPGHQTEWAKLLMILERYRAEDWMLPKAMFLFDITVKRAWDTEHGGICYGFDPEGNICDGDKYFWVQAESLVAAALLANHTSDPKYWDWYDRIWDYAWEHMVDHHYGAWYRILDRQNNKYDDLKSPAGKTDYHTMGACYEVLNVLSQMHRSGSANELGSKKSE